MMASLKVTVPDPMKAWVRARVREGSSKSASGYIQMLIRRKQEEAKSIAAIRQSDEAIRQPELKPMLAEVG